MRSRASKSWQCHCKSTRDRKFKTSGPSLIWCSLTLLLISCLFIRGYTKNVFASPYKTVWRPFFYNPSMLEKCWTYSSMWKAVTEWEASFLQGTSSATPQLSGVLRSQFLFSCGPQECGSHNDRNSTTNIFFSSHVKRFVESSLLKSPELHFAVLH